MVFKLIRVDSQEPRKIGLATGTHVIGRGKFLHNDDKDKRVSRNHAELSVTEDVILLKSLHQNPCFYIKKNTIDTEILDQNSTVFLNNGDKFGLLPDNFWYEVIQCSDSDEIPISKNDEKEYVEEKNKADETHKEQSDKIIEENNIEFRESEENVQPDRSESPSLLNEKPVNQESTQPYNADEQAPNFALSSPNKRSHDSLDPSSIDSKKLKMEPVSPSPQPGPSNDQAASNSDVDKKPNINAPASPTKPPAPLRERCMYGANCYRRNPQHKAQFSHPSDADWGPGARGVCPYGVACRRTDPRHWQNHEHPPGVNPPPPNMRRPGNRRKKPVKQNRASDSEDNGDSPRTDLIVTGKRSRKTVNRDTWGLSGSEEDEDPYKTDESDEWQPPSDFTNSEDFSQNL